MFFGLSNITVQDAMQRSQVRPSAADLAGTSDSPVGESVPTAQRIVPDSFSEWLARPSQTISIAGDSEPHQGIFAALLNECPAPLTTSQPAGPRAT